MGLYKITGEAGYFPSVTGFNVGETYQGTYVGFNQVHLEGYDGGSLTLPLESLEVVEHDIRIGEHVSCNRSMKGMFVIDCKNNFYPTDLEDLTVHEYIELMDPKAIFHEADGHYTKIWDERKGFVR